MAIEQFVQRAKTKPLPSVSSGDPLSYDAALASNKAKSWLATSNMFSSLGAANTRRLARLEAQADRERRDAELKKRREAAESKNIEEARRAHHDRNSSPITQRAILNYRSGLEKILNDESQHHPAISNDINRYHEEWIQPYLQDEYTLMMPDQQELYDVVAVSTGADDSGDVLEGNKRRQLDYVIGQANAHFGSASVQARMAQIETAEALKKNSREFDLSITSAENSLVTGKYGDSQPQYIDFSALTMEDIAGVANEKYDIETPEGQEVLMNRIMPLYSIIGEEYHRRGEEKVHKDFQKYRNQLPVSKLVEGVSEGYHDQYMTLVEELGRMQDTYKGNEAALNEFLNVKRKVMYEYKMQLVHSLVAMSKDHPVVRVGGGKVIDGKVKIGDLIPGEEIRIGPTAIGVEGPRLRKISFAEAVLTEGKLKEALTGPNDRFKTYWNYSYTTDPTTQERKRVRTGRVAQLGWAEMINQVQREMRSVTPLPTRELTPPPL